MLERFSVTFPAGGWVVVSGDKRSHAVFVKWDDGRDYAETEIEYGVDAPVVGGVF